MPPEPCARPAPGPKPQWDLKAMLASIDRVGIVSMYQGRGITAPSPPASPLPTQPVLPGGMSQVAYDAQRTDLKRGLEELLDQARRAHALAEAGIGTMEAVRGVDVGLRARRQAALTLSRNLDDLSEERELMANVGELADHARELTSARLTEVRKSRIAKSSRVRDQSRGRWREREVNGVAPAPVIPALHAEPKEDAIQALTHYLTTGERAEGIDGHEETRRTEISRLWSEMVASAERVRATPSAGPSRARTRIVVPDELPVEMHPVRDVFEMYVAQGKAQLDERAEGTTEAMDLLELPAELGSAEIVVRRGADWGQHTLRIALYDAAGVARESQIEAHLIKSGLSSGHHASSSGYITSFEQLDSVLCYLWATMSDARAAEAAAWGRSRTNASPVGKMELEDAYAL